MSIPASCPGCRTSYQLADTLRGKKVRCKSCSEVFLVGGKGAASDRDEDDERIQASPRPAKRAVLRDMDEEEMDRPQPRRRLRKENSNTALVPLLIAGGILAGVLGLGLIGFGAWAWSRSQLHQATPVAANMPPQGLMPPHHRRMRFPPADPNPAANGANANQPPMMPPGNPFAPPPAPAIGPVALELSNGKVSGFGAQMEVSVDYRFTSGNPAGRRLFLLIKATKAGGFLQNYYRAELRTLGNQTRGTINAKGMSFGLEHGPFEMWVGEGSGMIGPFLNDRDLQKISNVVTVAGEQMALPGMRTPFGPRPMLP